jgi:hypothetical protein
VPVLCVPIVLFVPLQPPEAVHDVALAELHVSEEAAPLAIEVGFAASVTAGVPGTVTVAVAILLVPPAPVHVNENDVVAVSAPVLWLPPVASAPLQPPEAMQEVALVELHVSVDAPPLTMDVGFAVSAIIGAGTTLTVAVAILLVPPAPVHVNENDVVAVSAPVLWLPLVASAPLQPPEAVHDVAADELQISVEAVPLLTVVCAAPRDAVGCGRLVEGVTPAPPHAANTRDAATGTNRIPGSQDLIVINHPRAIRNCTLVRDSIRSWPAARQAMLARVQAVSSSDFIE